MRMVVLRSVSFVMTPPADSTPMSKRVTSKSSRSCVCEDASPERVATKKEPYLAKTYQGSLVTRVGLLKVFKEVERNATPGPAPVTPRKARKPRSRRRRLQGPANQHDPRKHARAQSEPTSVATPNRKHTKRQEEQIKCPSTWSAWRLCADGGDACREHAD